MLNGLKIGSQHFVHNFQTIMIFRELQKKFGEIYLGGTRPYVSHNFAITIGDTWTCLTCKTQKSPKISKDLSLILPLEKM